MKKLIKHNSRKGFTLLEVMLAVAVLAIASTMIMQGFIAVMNVANNSSVYSRIGSSNYEKLVTRLAIASNTDSVSRYNTTIFPAATTKSGSLSLSIGGTAINNVGLYYWRETGNNTWSNRTGTTSGVTINVAGHGNYDGDVATDALVDNRTAFYYIPQISDGTSTYSVCPSCGGVGTFRYSQQGSKKGWVCFGTNATTGSTCYYGASLAGMTIPGTTAAATTTPETT